MKIAAFKAATEKKQRMKQAYLTFVILDSLWKYEHRINVPYRKEKCNLVFFFKFVRYISGNEFFSQIKCQINVISRLFCFVPFGHPWNAISPSNASKLLGSSIILLHSHIFLLSHGQKNIMIGHQDLLTFHWSSFLFFWKWGKTSFTEFTMK